MCPGKREPQSEGYRVSDSCKTDSYVVFFTINCMKCLFESGFLNAPFSLCLPKLQWKKAAVAQTEPNSLWHLEEGLEDKFPVSRLIKAFFM